MREDEATPWETTAIAEDVNNTEDETAPPSRIKGG
jgi:hypothetical protein